MNETTDTEIEPKSDKKKKSCISGTKCCLPHCGKSKRTDAKLKIFRFPYLDKYLLKIWLDKCKFDDEYHLRRKEPLYICEKHFSSDCIGEKYLRRSAVPTLNLTENETTTIIQIQDSTSSSLITLPSIPERPESPSITLPSIPERPESPSITLPSIPERSEPRSINLPITPERPESPSITLPSIPERSETSSITLPSIPERPESTSTTLPNVPMRPQPPPEECLACRKSSKNEEFYKTKYLSAVKKLQAVGQDRRAAKVKNEVLKRKIKRLETKLKSVKPLEVQIDNLDITETEKTFCKMLIKQNRRNTARWDDNETSLAKSIFQNSTLMYRFLRNKLKLNLPSHSSLSRWKCSQRLQPDKSQNEKSELTSSDTITNPLSNIENQQATTPMH